MNVKPPMEYLIKVYSELWGSHPNIGVETEEREEISPLLATFKPITPAEVGMRIKRMKASSSPGVDGIEKRHIGG